MTNNENAFFQRLNLLFATFSHEDGIWFAFAVSFVVYFFICSHSPSPEWVCKRWIEVINYAYNKTLMGEWSIPVSNEEFTAALNGLDELDRARERPFRLEEVEACVPEYFRKMGLDRARKIV